MKNMEKFVRDEGFGLPAILVVVSVLLVVSAGGWLIFQEKRQQKTDASSVSSLAEITNSGSTNFAGWDLKLYTNGSGRLTCNTGPQSHISCASKTYNPGTFPSISLKKDLANTDLHGYMSTCIGSVSFGSTDTLLHDDSRVSGIDCYAQSEHTPLANDLNAVLSKIDVQS